MTDEEKAAFEAALPALAAFKHTCGRDATPGFVAELYAAREFNLMLLKSANAPGADATDANGKRYQVKYRSPDVLNIDLNNFDFDYIVLVNVDADYRLAGIWRLTVDRVRAMCVYRAKFQKHQVTQARFKDEALRCQGLTS